MADDDLKRRQEAGALVEKRMIEFLIQFHPAGELKVDNVRAIAFEARRLAFDAFSNQPD